MKTKNQVLTHFLNDPGMVVGNNHVTYTLTDVPQEVDVTTYPLEASMALAWNDPLQKWLPGPLIELETRSWLFQSDVDNKIKEIVGAAPSQVDSLVEITAAFGSDIANVEALHEQINFPTMKVFTGNGVQKIFDIIHTAGKISVSVNGIEKIYNITDYADITGILELSLQGTFDFFSIDDQQIAKHAQQPATKIEFVEAPLDQDNIEIRIY